MHVENIGHTIHIPPHMVSLSQRLTALMSFGFTDDVGTQTAVRNFLVEEKTT